MLIPLTSAVAALQACRRSAANHAHLGQHDESERQTSRPSQPAHRKNPLQFPAGESQPKYQSPSH